jgi:hypothetical protein
MTTPQTKRPHGISPAGDDFTLEQVVGGMLRDRYDETVGDAPPERIRALLQQLAGPQPEDSREPRKTKSSPYGTWIEATPHPVRVKTRN